MNYYIVDDNIATVKNIENLIEDCDLGKVIGSETDPDRALEEIVLLEPDIVLVDLLMGKKDGITLVKELKERTLEVTFVMISQVRNKEMVAEAYNMGVDFFINKPLNITEIKAVLERVRENIVNKKLLKEIKGMIDVGKGRDESGVYAELQGKDSLKDIRKILKIVGVLGEKGAADIMTICQYCIDNNTCYNREVLEEACKMLGDSGKNVEQRMRRAMRRGLTNMANLNMDDYNNEVFCEYGSFLFDFSEVKVESDYITGMGTARGRVRINKFIDGLLTFRDLM